MSYLLHLLVQFLIYAMLTTAAGIAVGYGGMLTMALGAVWGGSAYLVALLSLRFGIDFVPALFLSIPLVAILAREGFSRISHLRGDDFVLASLGVQMVCFSGLYNLTALTGGPVGLRAIPPTTILGHPFESRASMLLICGLAFALVSFVSHRMLSISFGRSLRAACENPEAAAASGKNIPAIRSNALAWAAALSVLPAALFGSYFGYLSPSEFGISESILILSAVIIGGSGRWFGPLIGALAIVGLPELLRALPLSQETAANLRQVAYGAVLILLMRLRPRGLFGTFSMTD